MTESILTRTLQEACNPEQRDANLWAKCFVEAEGDEKKAQALYVKSKVPQPKESIKGFCPSCTSECPMDAKSCSHCGANFVNGGWKPSLQKPRPAYGSKVADSHNPNLVKTAKSRGVYIIIGLFFGMLGIHNFYIGRYMRGIIQMLSTLIFGWIIIGLVVTFIWVFFDFFTVTEDGAGDPLS